MRVRSLMIVGAVALLSACAAEDPLLESSVPTVPDPTAETSVATTTTVPDDGDHGAADTEAHEDEHEDAGHGDDAAVPGGAVDATNTREVEVTMTDFSFEPSVINVAGGETVTFIARNEGAIEHEFRLSNAHRIEEHIASGHADHDEAGEGHHAEDADIILLVAAGETAELVFEVPEDTTLYSHVACLLPGHYEAGMVADLTISGSSDG